jgi:uncharacterized protein YndB with AHSA1/START domain
MAARKKRDATEHIDITRVYDAPVKAVWKAWTDPVEAAKWWGPRGFTITHLSKDLKPGGHWSYIMHGPDGVNYPNRTTYYEVEECAKLVYDHGASEDKPPLFRVTVTFSESQGKTTMRMRMTFATVPVAIEMGKFIKQAGGNATWDRLDEYLGQTLSNEERFVINRSFEAPIATVFEMWTNPKLLAQWLPPTGSRMEFLAADIRTGGSSHYVMTNDQFKMFGRANYLEIVPTDRLVYTQEFCDEKGGLSRHPLAPTWPEAMLTVVQFYAEGPDQTRVQVTWRAHGKVSAEELATFVGARAGMTMGWTGSFDKLDATLESAADGQ